jgi:SM-20-related protein
VALFVSDGVTVHDGLFNDAELNKFLETTGSIPLYFVNQADYRNIHELYCHWFYPLVITEEPYDRCVEPEVYELDETLAPIRIAWERVKPLMPAGARLYNFYLNGNTYGTEGYPHYEVGGARAGFQYSALVYCPRSWQHAWGGETVFFDTQNEICASVLPRPGRAVIFRGDILHAARSPSRFCPIERRVLVFKVWLPGCPPAG